MRQHDRRAAASGAEVHVTVPADAAHDGSDSAGSNVMPAGRTSVSSAFVAADGPAFVTVTL